MKSLTRFSLGVLLLLLSSFMAGCATTGGSVTVKPVETLIKPAQEIPEAQLLNVDIALFDPGKLPEQENKARGLSMEIRKAEARFMPVHLRAVMEKTGYWGAVRVVPGETEGFELRVSGLIIDSDGEVVTLKIEAVDAAGQLWLSRIYKHKVTADEYSQLPAGRDAYQALYLRIANDLARFRDKLSNEQRTKIREIADMRFAADMAPDAFAGHIRKNELGQYQLLRLPAADDPAYQRVQVIRERDFLLIDTLNGHYDNFYRDMRSPYEEWRKARSIEKQALREVKNKANASKALGIAAILAAIAIEATGSSDTRAATGTLRDVMILGGGYAIKRGMDINAESTIHEEQISELGISFSSEAEPMVLEVDGEVHKLTGSAETQYAQWRQLMREIYASETGLPVITEIEEPPTPESSSNNTSETAEKP